MAEIYGIPYYILIPVGFFVALYLYVTRNFGHWKKLGIPEVPPLPFTGSFRFDLSSHQGKTEQEWSRKYGKIFGIYEGPNPNLLIADPELLRNILVKDFNIFSEIRDLQFGQPLVDRMLFLRHGENWKEVRNIMTPTFTSGKMKMMSKLINECGKILTDNLKKEIKNNKEVDIIQYIGAFTIDVIARCAFGVKLDSSNEQNNAFVVAARKALKSAPWRFLLGVTFPGIAKLIRLSLFDPSSCSFFKNVILEVMEKRKNEKDQKSKDFLQLMMDAESENQNNKNEKKILEIDDIVAQCIMFFLAGYFTTTATISFAAHHLATNPDIQDRLIEEIDKNLADNKELDYDTVFGMKYLDAFVQETLRYHCPNPRVERKCIQDYKLGDTGIIIPKNTIVAVPNYVINHNPEYFPEPEKFNPDRFLPENKDSIHPYANLPFGVGPRGCLGMRFALMEIKMALVNILQQFKFKPGVNTKSEPEFLKSKGIHCPKDIFLKLELRK